MQKKRRKKLIIGLYFISRIMQSEFGHPHINSLASPRQKQTNKQAKQIHTEEFNLECFFLIIKMEHLFTFLSTTLFLWSLDKV